MNDTGGHASFASEILRGSEHLTVEFEDRTTWRASDLAARALQQVGDVLRDSDAVVVPMTTSPETIGTVLAAVACGSRLIAIPPLPSNKALPFNVAQLARDAAASATVSDTPPSEHVEPELPPTHLVRTFRGAGGRGGATDVRDGFELVQLTSGSTGTPQPILHDERTLLANVTAVLRRLEVESGDRAASWLPLSHDMGLIGMLFGSLLAASWIGATSLTLVRPEYFLRSPARWLHALSESKTTITAMPDFGLRESVRRPKRDGLATLSRLRAIIVGAETVRAESLRAFEVIGSPAGLSTRSLCPAYGMAEFGVAVSINSPKDMWNEYSVALPGGGVTSSVGCGAPLDGYAVVSDQSLLGELVIQGPSLGQHLDGTPLASDGHGYRTGDIGRVDLEVSVLGRTSECLVVHGRPLLASNAEGAVPPDLVRGNRVAACTTAQGRFTILFEPSTRLSTTQLGTAVREVRRAVAAATGASPEVVIALRRGELPMTASGKVKRDELLLRATVRDFKIAALLE